MRDETRKKLDRMVSARDGQWLIRGGMGILAGVVLVLVVQVAPPPDAGRQLNATMKAALIHVEPETPHPIIELRVELEDGRLVRAASRTGTTPPVNGKIVLTEYEAWFGGKTLVWDGRMQ